MTQRPAKILNKITVLPPYTRFINVDKGLENHIFPLVPVDESVFGDIIEELLKMFIDDIGITFLMKKSNSRNKETLKQTKIMPMHHVYSRFMTIFNTHLLAN